MPPRQPDADLHQLLAAPHGAQLHRELAQRLRLLGGLKETPQARGEIELALTLRWWGLRRLAIRAVGNWGGQGNRAWLTERARRSLLASSDLRRLPRGDAGRWRQQETVAAREAVCALVEPEDADWILELWFAGFDRFSGLHPALFSKLPPDPVMRRVDSEIAGGDPERGEAALWLLFNRPWLPGRLEAMARLTHHRHPGLSAQAGRLLANLRLRDRE